MVLGNCSNFKDHLLKMFPVCQGMLPGVDFKLTALDPFSLYNPNVMIANIFCSLILSQPQCSVLFINIQIILQNSYCPFLFLNFLFFRAAPTACESSQARGRIGAVATDLHGSHSNSGSEPKLQPTPQRTATPDPWPTEQGQGSNLQPHGY